MEFSRKSSHFDVNLVFTYRTCIVTYATFTCFRWGGSLGLSDMPLIRALGYDVTLWWKGLEIREQWLTLVLEKKYTRKNPEAFGSARNNKNSKRKAKLHIYRAMFKKKKA